MILALETLFIMGAVLLAYHRGARDERGRLAAMQRPLLVELIKRGAELQAIVYRTDVKAWHLVRTMRSCARDLYLPLRSGVGSDVVEKVANAGLDESPELPHIPQHP